MDELSDIEFQALYQLASLEKALTRTVTDPVVAPDKNGMMAYIDCIGSKDQAYGLMNSRFKADNSAIKRHVVLHGDMVDSFEIIGARLYMSDSLGVSSRVEILARQLFEHAEVVRAHNVRLGANAFLEYPSVNGDYFTIPEQFSDSYRFNTDGTYRGFLESVRLLEAAISRFSNSTADLPTTTIGVYEGLPFSYKSQLGHTKKLIHDTREKILFL